MDRADGLRPFAPTTLLIAGLALSLGWGIRGNFGHEYGAAFAGGIAAIAIALLCGRADWRERVAYFGFFGALGWGFGGAISFGHANAYAYSGELSTRAYGLFAVFVIGFLWAGIGGMGTALPAVANRDRLTALFKPLSWVFGAWVIQVLFVSQIESWESSYEATWSRHESLLYWFDTDWLDALFALIGLCAYDCWEQASRTAQRRNLPIVLVAAVLALAAGWWMQSLVVGLAILGGAIGGVVAFAYPILAAYAVAGLAIGWSIHVLISALHLEWSVSSIFLQHQIDLEFAKQLAVQEGEPLSAILARSVINWPGYFRVYPQHIGWSLGLAGGVFLYFRRFGRFANGAGLFAYMAVGFFVAMLVFPVLFGFGGAGLRLTPPRGESWAGALGTFAGAFLWLMRNNLVPVAATGLVSGALGGLAYASGILAQVLMRRPGNPTVVDNPEVVEAWAHYQSANWHSFLEQTWGLFNGIAVAIAVGMLARRKGRLLGDPRQRRWTEVYAVVFLLFGLAYLNIQKNPIRWVDAGVVPEIMTLPWFQSVEVSPYVLFALVWLLAATVATVVMARHLRRPIAALPTSWLGKGQLLFIAVTWTMVVANFERALPSFGSGRLITELPIVINAIAATTLLLLVPQSSRFPRREGTTDYSPVLNRGILATVASLLIAVVAYTAIITLAYGGEGSRGVHQHLRFGPDATWRVAPILFGKDHA